MHYVYAILMFFIVAVAGFTALHRFFISWTTKSEKVKKDFKIGGTVLSIIAVAALGYGIYEWNNVDNNQADAATASSSPTNRVSSKDAAEQLNTLMNRFKFVSDGYSGIIDDLNSGSIDQATAYNKFDRLRGYALQVFSDSQSSKFPPDYSKDQETLTLASSYMENSIKHIMNYFDDKKTSTLANAQSEFQEAQKGFGILKAKAATTSSK